MGMATTNAPISIRQRLGISKWWWLGLPIVGAVYTLLKWGGPAVADGIGDGTIAEWLRPILESMAPNLAPLAAVLVLGWWGFEVYQGAVDARRLDSQTGLDSIRDLSWREFEQLLATAFRRQGYGVDDTGPGADGGVDLVLHGKGGRILVQAKHWKARKVGVQKVRELLGVCTAARAAGGILATSGEATAEARRFARANRIDLIEGRELEQTIRDVQRRPAGSVSPQPAVVVAEPECPRCGSPMVRRTARQGAKAGRDFWGCSTYPKCRGTRDITGPPLDG